MPGSVLLSHGETPHYHRRYGVSLLSSAWGQVGPPRYCRQTNSVPSRLTHTFVVSLNQKANLEQAAVSFTFRLLTLIESTSSL